MSSIGSKFCSSAEDVDLDDGDATMNDQPDHSFSNIELMSLEPAAAAAADSESEQESELQEEEQEKHRDMLQAMRRVRQQQAEKFQQQTADAKLVQQEHEKQRLLEQEQETQRLLEQEEQQLLQQQEQEKRCLLEQEQEQEQEQEKQRRRQAFKRQFARFVMKEPNYFETATDDFAQYFDKLVIPVFEDRTGQLTRYCAAANRANELGVKDDSNELIGDEMFKNTINNFQKWGAEEMKVMLEKHDVYINSFEQKKAKGAAEYTILFASCGEEEKVIPKNPLERREWETINKVLLQSVVNKKGRIARKNVFSQNKKDMKLKQLRGMTDSNSVDNGANKQLRRSARSSSVAGSVVNLEGDKNLKLPRDEFFKNLSDKK